MSGWKPDLLGGAQACLRRLAVYSRRVKILFIGDVVGSPGRKAVTELVPVLRARSGAA